MATLTTLMTVVVTAMAVAMVGAVTTVATVTRYDGEANTHNNTHQCMFLGDAIPSSTKKPDTTVALKPCLTLRAVTQ